MNTEILNFNFYGMRKNVQFFVVTFVSALVLGQGLNILRTSPLPPVYQTKATRLWSDMQMLPFDISELALEPGRLDKQADLALEEFEILLKTKKIMLLDARPAIFYELGHIPGSLSLPREDFHDAFMELSPVLTENMEKQVVIYCSDASCEDSSLVKSALQALGFSSVSIFRGGWAEWQNSQVRHERK